MSGPDYDAELEAFLKRRSPMYRRLSDIDHAEPSLELDRVVLNRAREAIDSPSQPPMYRTTRWALPLGLAATILIAFTVVLNIDHGSGAPKTAASSGSPPAVADARARAPVAAPTALRVAPVKESVRVDQPRVLSDTAEARRDERSAKKADAPAALAKRSEAPQRPNAADNSADSERYVASSNALASNVRVAPPASPAPAEAQAGAAAAPDPHASAESWLREIKRLRAAGKTADADRELAAFRQAYPTHPAYSVAKPPAR